VVHKEPRQQLQEYTPPEGERSNLHHSPHTMVLLGRLRILLTVAGGERVPFSFGVSFLLFNLLSFVGRKCLV
jgi:hypothetical protein